MKGYKAWKDGIDKKDGAWIGDQISWYNRGEFFIYTEEDENGEGYFFSLTKDGELRVGKFSCYLDHIGDCIFESYAAKKYDSQKDCIRRAISDGKLDFLKKHYYSLDNLY